MKRKGNDDELYLANVLHFDNCTVYLYRPILTPEENRTVTYRSRRKKKEKGDGRA